MPAKIAAWCRGKGHAPPATDGEFARAILESLALRYRNVVENLESLAGRRIEVIHIVGGGSRNSLLNQFVADCTGDAWLPDRARLPRSATSWCRRWGRANLRISTRRVPLYGIPLR